MQMGSKTFVLALAASLSVPSMVSRAQTATPKPAAKANGGAVSKDVPAEFQAAISQIHSAKSSLEKAGDKWCGHRVKAISLIDQTFRVLGQASAPSPSEIDSGQQDEPGELESGITALESAKSDFEISGNAWRGRREKAMSLISKALDDFDWESNAPRTKALIKLLLRSSLRLPRVLTLLTLDWSGCKAGRS